MRNGDRTAGEMMDSRASGLAMVRERRRRDAEGEVRRRRWYALVTAPKREFIAALLLGRMGLLVVNPVELVERRLNRYRKVTGRRPRPLLTSMVLCGFDPEVDLDVAGVPPWLHVLNISVIAGVVGMRGVPVPISADAVLQLDAASGRQGQLRRPPLPARPAFVPRVGQTVRFVDGMFRGYEGRVIEPANENVRVQLGLLGKEAEITVPVEMLLPAS